MKLNMFRATHRPSSEPKTALAASGFPCVEGCWTCSWWTLSGTVLCLTTSTNYTSNSLPRMENQRLPVQFWALMMGGVSPETCWASYKYGIIKFWYTVTSCRIFLYELNMEHSQVQWIFHSYFCFSEAKSDSHKAERQSTYSLLLLLLGHAGRTYCPYVES